MSKQAIGVFDSGMGGLTVAKEIKRILPEENILYFGDTMHLPYGDKSKETIVGYSQKIADFLLRENCKSIVVACNTASSYAFSELKEQVPKGFHVFDVISPVAEKVAFELHQKIGVIGTKATVNSGIYKQKIWKLNRHLKVVEFATSLFVPIIEEGFTGTSISRDTIDAYLSNKKLQDIDSLILGCTHYPLLSNEIGKYFGGKVQIINSPLIVANAIKSALKANDLLNQSAEKPTYTFYVSDMTKSFQKQAQRFFGKEIGLTEKKLI